MSARKNSSSPLRVCFVSADYPTHTSAAGGGIGAHAYALARSIARLGHEVLVLTESDGTANEYWDGLVRVHALQRPSPRYWKLGSLLPVPWIRRSFAVWHALQSLQRQHRFDLVRFPDGYGEGFRFSLSPFTPYSVHLHGPASLLQRWDGRYVPIVRARAEAMLERRPASHATLLVAGTRRFADMMTSEWSLDSSRIRIIRNPIDIDEFRPGPPGSRPTGQTVLFAGHLQWLKGLSTFAAAIPLVLAKHPRVSFQFIGNDTKSAPGGGSIRRLMEDALAPSGALGNVSFLDPMPHRQLVAYYRACSTLVLPSFHEAYGNVVIEAMACGRPCVVTSTVGACELIAPGKTGLIVPPNDPAALASAISQMVTMSDDARDEAGRQARLAVEQRCATPVIAAQTVDAYREIVQARQVAARRNVGDRP